MFLEKLKSVLQDPPPAMAFEITEAGIAVARIGARAEPEFQPMKPGTLTVSPLKENVVDADEFSLAVQKMREGITTLREINKVTFIEG